MKNPARVISLLARVDRSSGRFRLVDSLFTPFVVSLSNHERHGPSFRYRWARAASLLLSLVFSGTTAAAEPTAVQRQLFADLERAARADPEGAWRLRAAPLRDYPLWPYVEYAALSARPRSTPAKQVLAFVSMRADSPLAMRLRRTMLDTWVEQKRWEDALSLDHPELGERGDCHVYAAALARGKVSDALAHRMLETWAQPHVLPPACEPMQRWLDREQRITPKRVDARIAAAREAGNAAVLSQLAVRLPLARSQELARIARAMQNPTTELANAAGWTDTEANRVAVGYGVAALAKRDSNRAIAQWQRLEPAFKWQDAERGRALAGIGLWRAASYLPDASIWLARVPEASRTDQLREWQVREAQSRGDHKATVAAFEAMTEAQRADPRFRYAHARALDLDRQREAARAAYAALAAEPTYHGFLAADHAGVDYRLCPLDAPTDEKSVRAVATSAGLVRAFELRAIDRHSDARAEFDFALRNAEPDVRRAAVARAIAREWYDRGPFTLTAGADLRYYALRFPLAERDLLAEQARGRGVDLAWVYGLIRAESAWIADAVSHANAHGLMQLLPGTAQSVARRQKITYPGVGALTRQPRLNLMLGTHHIADELARFNGKPWLATAAYNAGPAPVNRWLSQRPNLPNDLWIETIPYKETREYVSRVMAFSVIHDWRLKRTAMPVSARIGLAPSTAPRKPVNCPATSQPAAKSP